MNELKNEKFLLDCMLGKLARWLRFAGFDTLYFKNIDDDELINIAIKENRILITRDKNLYRKIIDKSIFVNETDIDRQLYHILKLYTANKNCYLTRCAICNTVLSTILEDPVKKCSSIKHPKTIKTFYYCTYCNKIYWNGSHSSKIINKLNNIQNDLLKKEEFVGTGKN